MTFANRNYMVRVLFYKFSRGEEHLYAEFWLQQQHPFGYSIDYFDTIESAKAAIDSDDVTRNERMGYKHTYVIYKMVVVE